MSLSTEEDLDKSVPNTVGYMIYAFYVVVPFDLI